MCVLLNFSESLLKGIGTLSLKALSPYLRLSDIMGESKKFILKKRCCWVTTSGVITVPQLSLDGKISEY